MAMGSYKGEIFQYIAKADCIITSSKGVALYKKDLASAKTVDVQEKIKKDVGELKIKKAKLLEKISEFTKKK